MNQEFYEAVEANPVIAAVKNDAGLQAAVEMEEIQVIFVLYGDVCTIPEILERIKAAGKKAMVHIDLIAGLSAKEISVEFIARQTRADGSSRQNRHWCGGQKNWGFLRYFAFL